MRVILAMPTHGQLAYKMAQFAFYHATGPESDLQVRAVVPGGSLLAANFNACWATALNEYEAGNCDGFAMLHGDVAPELFFLDKLRQTLDESGADLVSAVIPIKDGRGLTSTALDTPGDPYRPRRLTMTEVHALPETFTDADAGGQLLLNTGCWLCRLGPWCKSVCFRTHDIIRRENGRWQQRVIPEDWDFSRQCRHLGVRLAATRAVKIDHWGDNRWSNQEVWGWETDTANAPAAVGGAA